MWAILESRIDWYRLPQHILEKYEVWKNVVRHSGPEGLLRIKGFKDHGLEGKWKGFRSSYLSDSYRVIYKVERTALHVTVERVSKHDYRK